MSDVLPFPLLAIVGQPELKTALVLALINPQIGGVLLIGPYGVGKTTAVRSLTDVMPPKLLTTSEAAETQAPTDEMRIVELPLNARLEDVVGGVNQRVALEQQVMLLEEGVLARAHGHVLYIDEINKLEPQVVDAILDAAAQGRTFVRRGPMVRLFPSQFVLIGSMNPEEGELRPQILDRLGLRVWVSPLTNPLDRLEVYKRAKAFRDDPAIFRRRYTAETAQLREDIAAARAILPHVSINAEAEHEAIRCIQELAVPSHRAEITLLEAARARAAADYRHQATVEDVHAVAVLALRLRRSEPLARYAERLHLEDQAIQAVLKPTPAPSARPAKRSRSRRSDEHSNA